MEKTIEIALGWFFKKSLRSCCSESKTNSLQICKESYFWCFFCIVSVFYQSLNSFLINWTGFVYLFLKLILKLYSGRANVKRWAKLIIVSLEGQGCTRKLPDGATFLYFNLHALCHYILCKAIKQNSRANVQLLLWGRPGLALHNWYTTPSSASSSRRFIPAKFAPIPSLLHPLRATIQSSQSALSFLPLFHLQRL